MARKIKIKTELPLELNLEQAIEIAYGSKLDEVYQHLNSRLSTLVECEKEIVSHLIRRLRARIRDKSKLKLNIISGVPQKSPDNPEQASPRGDILATTLANLRNAIYQANSEQVLCVLNLDLLTTVSHSGLTGEAREVAALLYENPEALLLCFKDPSFELPEVIADLFPCKTEISGIPRSQLPKIITQKEARKFNFADFDPFILYKYTSGLNIVRFRRIVSSFTDKDANSIEIFPDVESVNADSTHKQRIQQLRRMTVKGNFELPNISFKKDIGGYEDVKNRLSKEIIELINKIDSLENKDEIENLEKLIPRGIIFTGPPGTGKTLFAKALATELNATVIVVSGPELKSKWFGETEQNIRRIFARARQSAPSIIIFDELDSIAPSRSQGFTHDVTHSAVNQLLTEMDGFRSDELVFVVGTTNFKESLDPALLRPGRFELKIEIAPPNTDERKAIIQLYINKLNLKLSDADVDYLVQRTENYYDFESRMHFSGDHLYAIMKAIKREAIRRNLETEVSREILDNVFIEIKGIQTKLTPEELAVSAVHESGHAILMEMISDAPNCQKISILSEDDFAAGYTVPQIREKKMLKAEEVRALICVAFGGRIAEELIFETTSIGSEHDLHTATEIARYIVTVGGLLGGVLGLRSYYEDLQNKQTLGVSADKLAEIDRQIEEILKSEYERGYEILKKNIKVLGELQAALLEKKVLYREDFIKIIKIIKKSNN